MGSTAQYGCTVQNRFAFSVDVDSDEEDPFESLKKLENKKKEEREKSTQKAKEAKELKDARNKAVKIEGEAEANKGLKSQNQEEIVPATKEGSAKPQKKPSPAKEEGAETAPPPVRGGPRGRGRGGPRGSARGARGNQENFPPPAEGGDAAAPTAAGEGGAAAAEGGRGRGRGGRGEFRGRGGGRGGGRGRGFAGGNRDFDRQSADPKSSVKPTEKREGGGRGNWGTDKDAIEDATAATTATVGEAPEAEAAEPVAEAAPVETTEAPPEVEAEKEPEEMTLDEWKALQSQSKPTAEFNVRRAGEGVDDAQWGAMVALKKKDEESDDSDEGEVDDREDEKHEDEDAEKKAKKKAGKQVLDIKFEFADPPQRGGRGRGFGGGRGGGRGRGEGRGRGRGVEGRGGGGAGNGGGNGNGKGAAAAAAAAVPKGDTIMEIDNQKEFPSLGGAPKVAAAAVVASED